MPDRAAYYREYNKANAEKRRAYGRVWREANRERIAAYRAVNKTIRAERARIRERARYAADRHRIIDGVADRRAKALGLFDEPVSRLSVADRDEWVCGICRMPVPIEGDWEIDHVVPLCHGGRHRYANVQLAHALCNSRKHKAMAAG